MTETVNRHADDCPCAWCRVDRENAAMCAEPSPLPRGAASKMTKRERLLDECLEDINAIMWNSHCLKGREFGRVQGEAIMHVLDRWARIADDSALDAAMENLGITDQAERLKTD